jgi:uncharacterized protein
MVRISDKKGKRRRARKNKNRVLSFFALIKWSTLLVLAGIILFLIGIIGEVFAPGPPLIDESELIRIRQVVFEEPNPPVHEVQVTKPTEEEAPRPRIAIIIDDMGYNEKIDEALLGLPLQLTFSFLPFAPFTRELEASAFQLGHTVLLHLPMQPQKKEWDPGPGALHLGDTEEQLKEIFTTDLSWVPHAVGVNNHMGSLYTENEKAMRNLMKMIRIKGLIFIDSVTTPSSCGYRLAIETGVKTAKRQIFLDNIHSEEKIHNQLEKLIEIAKKQGSAIGIGHPYPETLRALTTIAPILASDVKLVGIQELVQ